MEFGEVVRRRRMVRAYRDAPVEPAAVERILDAARRAPSAGFTQGCEFVVVTDAPTRRRLAEACAEPAYVARGFPRWVSAAPVHVVPCVSEVAYRRRYAEPDKAASAGPDGWAVPFWWVDGGAALMLVLLAAVDEGLAAGFLDVADRPALKAVLAIPDEFEPLGLVTIGHPARDRRPDGRPDRPPDGRPDRRSRSLRRGRRPLDDVVHRGGWGGR